MRSALEARALSGGTQIGERIAAPRSQNFSPTSYCRKKKAVHKTTSTDDKRLQNTLKRLGVNTIPGIEEVHIFKDDQVIHFVNPKGALAERLAM